MNRFVIASVSSKSSLRSHHFYFNKMNSKSGAAGSSNKRKAAVVASKKQSADLNKTRQDMLEEEEEDEEDEPVEMNNMEETDDNEDVPLPPPKTPKKKKKQVSRTVPSSMEETDNEDSHTQNTPPKKARKKISTSQASLLSAIADEMEQGNLDFSMDSPELKAAVDRQSPVIELGGNFAMLEVDTPYATKSVTIRRRYRKEENGEFNNYHFHVPFRRLPSLALACLQYCLIVPEINTIIKEDPNFTPRLKVLQKKLLTISGSGK